MIVSFKCKHTEKLHNRELVKRFEAFAETARKKLYMLHTTVELEDLRIPPSNRLEALKGDRKHQYSIRINIQWRICFTWHDGNAHDVEIVDYH
ncbi:type II toxin-antitoxin system RelE/ParE family toxin [Rickettsia endosymbiont of Polydrusus tereticollis]|uniref:type II toxin-antitoxin system RelE/ParE family toxin n=1 Tax=Rickettsia endosymbiont of Polydrusus tereticollis TaxID=3066251 RepID=UPI003132F152|nr:type II toxin-antitoxin system RelE/ParE family toxin [Rickettsia endosymbiont of Oxypoda opaca]